MIFDDSQMISFLVISFAQDIAYHFLSNIFSPSSRIVEIFSESEQIIFIKNVE